MSYAKHVVNGETLFVRIKRRGRKNCRVISLVTGEDYLVPRPELEEVSAEEAGVKTEDTSTSETLPPLPEESLTGDDVTQLMSENRVTIKALAARMGIGADQVRQARREGIEGMLLVHEWKQAITGTGPATSEIENVAA